MTGGRFDRYDTTIHDRVEGVLVRPTGERLPAQFALVEYRWRPTGKPWWAGQAWLEPMAYLGLRIDDEYAAETPEGKPPRLEHLHIQRMLVDEQQTIVWLLEQSEGRESGT